ncbi:MAG: PfkB family carbohydrate kinase [Intestinimonas sp.]
MRPRRPPSHRSCSPAPLYLSPNEHEAALIAGHPIRTDAQGVCREDVAAVAAAFRKKGVEHLIITLGENGSVAAGAEGIHETPCVRMPHVADPTAAGDSFVAAFCTGVCAGLPQGRPWLRQPYGGHHRHPYGGHPQSAHRSGGPGPAPGAGLRRL